MYFLIVMIPGRHQDTSTIRARLLWLRLSTVRGTDMPIMKFLLLVKLE